MKFATAGLQTLLLASIFCYSSAVIAIWISSFDNVSDYDVIRSDSAASDVACASLATSRLPVVQLVTFNSTTRMCTMYKCALSLPDCRKCRNLNSSNHRVWIPSSKADTCWTTVQHRVSDSVDFNRNWTDYKAGFGDGPNGNFWIGLESLNSLTSVSGGRKLRFLLKAWNGSESWVQYSSFSVGSESDWFRLSVSGFSSSHHNVGDSFIVTTGCKFSTKDKDNDNSVANCAAINNGAWWFDGCSSTRLNGVFYNFPAALSVTYGQGLIWSSGYGFTYSLMEVEMLVR